MCCCYFLQNVQEALPGKNEEAPWGPEPTGRGCWGGIAALPDSC